jgi:hypothetical protein
MGWYIDINWIYKHPRICSLKSEQLFLADKPLSEYVHVTHFVQES